MRILLAGMLILTITTGVRSQSVTELEQIDVLLEGSTNKKFHFLNQDEIQKLTSPIPKKSSRRNQDNTEFSIFSGVAYYFGQGSFSLALRELNKIEQKLRAEGGRDQSVYGMIAYWKGITYSRMQEYPAAIAHFQQALKLGYKPADIFYEYGQVLFAAEKLAPARQLFRQSLRSNHLRAVSLYYMGFISHQLKEKKQAVAYYRAIAHLPKEETSEVWQAAELQIADIYLEQAQKQASASVIQAKVIPQYQKALMIDEESRLSLVIREKILELQKKYDLAMLHLINGRPTLRPPHFLRIAMEAGLDTNVLFYPDETTLSSSDQQSAYTRTDLFGRYTFYLSNFISISPEFRVNHTRYQNRLPEIQRNDSLSMAPALRLAYEHSLFGKPAALLLDYEFNEVRRDLYAQNELVFNSRAQTFMLGERLHLFGAGESIFRLRYRAFESFIPSSNSATTSLVWEQLVPFSNSMLVFFTSYDRTEVEDTRFSTNAMAFRGDYLFPRIKNLFTPSLGLGVTSIDPINDRANRGRELMLNPNARLTRVLGKKWRSSLKYDYLQNRSQDAAFTFRKSIYALELEYLF
jgi:tetratricopeptide (TPR) repeat protein